MSGKRRIEDEEESDIEINSTDSEAENSDSEGEDIVNVDFDFFDVNKEIDFHAVKNLTRQLIGEDSKKINLSALTDLILDASTTTIKTDGKEGDPYAFLAPVSMKDAKSTDYVKYINQCDLDLSTQLAKVSNKKVSLLMSERFINMPIQVVAPLYKIVLDDVEKAEGSHFDFYLIPSRKYEVNDEAEGNSNKRVKTVEVDFYHYEDKYFEDNATHISSLESKKGVIQTFILISHDGLTKAVGQLEDAIAAAF